MIEGGKISDKAADILKKQIGAVEVAVAKRKNNLTPETTKALDTANAKLKTTVEKQKSRLAGNATADAKMGRLASLDRADEIFDRVKISVNGKEFKWKKGEMANFRLLPLEGKKDFLAKMEKALLEKPDATLATLEKFSRDSRIPKKWQEYCKTPEKWGQTKKQAAEWLLANADKKILQSQTVFKFLEKNNLVLEKAGVAKPSLESIFEKSTSEVNQFIDGAKSKIAKVDAEQAEHFEKLKISNKAEVKTQQAENKAVEKKEEAEKITKIETVAKGVQKFATNQNLGKLIEAKKAELEKKDDSDSVSEMANRRQQTQSGEKKPGFLKKLFGKKGEQSEAAENYLKEAEQKGEKVDLDKLAKKQAISELLGNNQTADDYQKALGVKGLSVDDLKKTGALLQSENFDAKGIYPFYSAEIAKILQNNQADDEMKKAA